jgi:hypothetical protein
MGLRTYAVLVEDTASDESASFVVEASSPLIACTRAANRLLGPTTETRPVYACAVCGADLWDGGAPDSSGFRFCEDCSPGELESRDEQVPVGLVAGTARISAVELARLPGDAPLGPVTVVAPAPDLGLERGDAFEDDDLARAAMARALRRTLPLEEALGDLAVRDSAGAFFRYALQPVAAPADADELVERGLLSEEAPNGLSD